MKSQKRLPEAKRFYEQAIAVNSRDPQARYELGRIALESNQPTQAVDHLRIASETKQQDPKLQYWYGRALETQGDQKSKSEIRKAYEGAAALLAQGEKTPASLCDVHYRVGLVHTQDPNELSLALTDFQRASECAPQRPDVWSQLAETYHKFGDRQQELKNYEQALRMNRNHVPSLLGVAQLYLSDIPPKTKKAKKALKRVLKRERKNPEAHFRMCSLLQSSSRRKAKSYCKRYLKLAPKGEFADFAKEIIRSL